MNFPWLLLLLESGRLVVDETFVCFGLLAPTAVFVGTPFLSKQIFSVKINRCDVINTYARESKYASLAASISG